ncbi:hypothetical protein PMKS-004181 [Pichia membranifaciens]|uniref:Uncharacterized protein n=1 Tax=Pichia membranifaciens TaxID=4926 RepID=A0A1Q2YMA5_9ASCO|nr:hypothetical protein PMKS-004181 [Pichia membranifaciens]
MGFFTKNNDSDAKSQSEFAESEKHLPEVNDLGFVDSSSVDLEDREYYPEYADEYNPAGLAMATAEDKERYRNVRTRPTVAAMLILVCEFAERGSYYGVQGILTNFIMRPLPEGSRTGRVMPGNDGNAGALGLGLKDANALMTDGVSSKPF